MTINPGTPDERVKCRACPQRTYWSSGGSCVPVDEDPDCPRPLQAVVSSWPDDCVFIFCPPDDDTPDLLEHRRLSNGACTHLDDNDVCPLNAEGVDDEKWFPEYGGCRKKRCSYGRYSTGTCRPRPIIPPPARPLGLASDPTPPTDVTADGHSPTDSSGQSVVTWEASDAAIQNRYTLARYELHYGTVPYPPLRDRVTSLTVLVDLLPDRWLPRDTADTTMEAPVTLSASSLTHTLTSLTLYTLYRVDVRAVYTAPPRVGPGGEIVPRPDKLSEWRHAYTYSTHDPIPSTDRDIVGVIPIVGFRPADPGATNTTIGQYRFLQCTNADRLPAGASSGTERDKLFRQVRLGFATWAAAYDDIDVRYITPRDCTTQELGDLETKVLADEAAGRLHYNVVIFAATGTELAMQCTLDNVAGCAPRWPDTAGPTAIRSTKIVLNKDLDYVNDLQDDVPCTMAYVIAMHEVGHAFGLGDTRSLRIPDRYGLWPTVMSDSMDSNCEPTALDIAAMKAIYQSR